MKIYKKYETSSKCDSSFGEEVWQNMRLTFKDKTIGCLSDLIALVDDDALCIDTSISKKNHIRLEPISKKKEGNDYLLQLAEKLVELVFSNFTTIELTSGIGEFSHEGRKSFAKMLSGTFPFLEKQKLFKKEFVSLVYMYYLNRFIDDGALENANNIPYEVLYEKYISGVKSSQEFKEINDLKNKHKVFLSTRSFPYYKENIYIDVTNCYITKANTGIQRVVKQICHYFPIDSYENVKCCVWDEVECSFFACEYINYSFSVSGTKILFNSGDVYFDIDGSWGNKLPRWELYSELKKGGVRIANIHYDAVPLLMPAYSHPTTVFNFIKHFYAMITFSDLVLCISKAVRDDFLELTGRLGGRVPPTDVIKMGFDLPSEGGFSEVKNHVNFEIEKYISDKKYILCVGTVEPRKNYKTILDLIPVLDDLDIILVLVGKEGWEKKSILDALNSQATKSTRFRWFKDVDDFSLDYLYKNAYIYLNTSHYEGYGLPVIEAMSKGCISITSNKGALPEAGQGVSLIYKDFNDLLRILKMLVFDGLFYSKSKELVGSFQLTTWKESALSVHSKLLRFFDRVDHKLDLGQLVYISIRPNDFRRSLDSFVKFYNVTSVVLLTKEILVDDFEDMLNSFNLNYRIFTDNEILPEKYNFISDHQERNFLLRKYLLLHNTINPNFIFLDDDCILLKKLPSDHFISVGKRYVGKCYLSSMASWSESPFCETSYDKGQIYTSKILKSHGISDFSFSSHQAQIINKDIINEIYHEYPSKSFRGMDEWSLYFNVALNRYPNLFSSSKVTTLYWPESYSQWLPEWFETDIYFENYYSQTYVEEDTDSKIDKYRKSYSLHSSYFHLNELLLTSIVAVDKNMSLNYPWVFGLAGIWQRLFLPVEYEGSFSYHIKEGEVIVVDGTRDVQNYKDQSGFMLKLPSSSGLFELFLYFGELKYTLPLFVFDVKEIS